MFRRLFHIGGPDPTARDAESWPRLVVTLPPGHAEPFHQRIAGIGETYPTLVRLFGYARRYLKIFSPYVDPTFTALLHSTQVPVTIVTTARDGRPCRPNAVLERCATTRGVIVRYVVEHRHKAQLFQMHAKLVLADGDAAYVGSANLTDTSLHYNLELGTVVTGRVELRALEETFDYVLTKLSIPARML